MTRVSLIGAGRMGGPMAQRLLGGGHALTVCDPAPAAVTHLAELGAEHAPDPRRAAARSEVTITCLPTPAIVEEAVLGDDGVLAGASGGSVLIDMSTSLPSLARRLAAVGAQRGVDVLDAPVTGGPRGATRRRSARRPSGRR